MGLAPSRLPTITPLVDAEETNTSRDVSPVSGAAFTPQPYAGRLVPPPADAIIGRVEGERPEMGEMLAAAWDNELLNNQISDDKAMGRAYNDFIHKARGAGLNIDWSPYNPGTAFIEREGLTNRIIRWHDQVNQQLENNPKLAESLGPISRETIAAMGDQISRDAYARYNSIKEQRGEGFWSLDTLAEFGVAMGASLTDPVQAATAFAGGGSKTIAGAFVKGAAINGAVEAGLQPYIISRQMRIGNIGSWEEGLQQAGNNVLFATALGGVLDGTFKAGEKGFEALFGGGRTVEPGAPQPEPDMPASFEPAREAMTALARVNEETDPESAAIIRKAMYDAERDFETARQAPEGVERDEFYDAVEAADAKLRGLSEFIERPEPRRADPPAERLDTTDDGPTPKVGDALVEDGKPVTFTSFDPRKLGVAPDEFQYKKFNGQEGVNGAIADVGQWHAPSSGKILVFERANGELVVADGHQRRSKALEISSAQGRDDIKLDGYLYREADGWTVAEMRLKGAQKNIREGRSDVLDTAQALRESPNAIDSSFPVSRSNIRQARQLARLSPEAWDLTRAGVLEPQHAALIGQVAPDRPEIHAPLARTLIEAAPDNQRQAENILSEALLDYAERDASTQASLFGDDNLGRAVLYKERAQIMDAAYTWLRSERSVFKALVEKGDIARALGNELVDAANLTAKDQIELAIAAIMHSRKAGVRTAVTDMISRALDSVRREGVTPTRAGQQVAREIKTLVEERGFRALLDAEGPRPPDMSDAGPLFDGPGSKAHAEHADLLEGDLRPEGIEDPGVDLAKTVETPDEMTSLVMELKNAEPGGERTPEQVLNDIRKLLAPEKPKASKSADPVQSAKEEMGAEFRRLDQAETALREALAPLTDPQKISLIRMQYPDAYATLNRLEGADLDDAIVGRVLLGDLMFARGRSDTPETYRSFHSDVLSDTQNKIVEMAMNGISNLDIGVEMGITAKSAREALARAKRKLAEAGEPVTIEPGAMGRPSEGKLPGEMKLAAIQLFEQGLEAQMVLARLQAQGFPTNIETVHVYYSNWRSAKRKGVKFALGGDLLVLSDRVYSPGQPDALGFITSAERALANPPARFRDAKALTAEQWRKLMREGGATKEAFTYQIEPALKSLADEGITGDIPKAQFEEALARNRKTLESNTSKGDPIEGVLGESPSVNRDYSAYVARGKFMFYRQEVLALPGLDYRSHNWTTQGAVGHIRTTERVAADGRKVLHVEELQSDLHQEGAQYGYKGDLSPQQGAAFEAKAKDDLNVVYERYKAWYNDATSKGELGLPKPTSLDADAANQIKDPYGRELFRNLMAADDRYRNASKKLFSGDSKTPPRAPMANWEEPFVRHVLQTAAKGKIDTVTFPTWETLHRALQNEGTKKFYDERLPNTLARVAKSLGLKVEAVVIDTGPRKGEYRYIGGDADVDFFETGGPATVPAIRLTPEAKAKLAEGVSMYALGDVDPRGATALEIIDQIKTEFGDGAMALMRVGELNVTDVPPAWVPGNTWGITDARGRVTLYAANVKPDKVRGLILHEVGVHAGLEGMLGAQGKARVLGDIEMRMRAASPDHPLFGTRAAPAKPAAKSPFEPLSESAAQDLVDLPEDQWADAIKANKYAAYELPDGVEDVSLPNGYVVVRTEDATYAVRQDHLRDREAAGARVTPLSGDKSIVAAMNKVPLNTPTEHIAEEVLAYLVQHAPKTDIVQRLIADIRTWLYKTFPKLQEWMTLTDADLHSLAMGGIRQRIREANRSLELGKTKSGGVFSTAGVKYAKPRADEQNPVSLGSRASVPGQPGAAGRANRGTGGRAGSGSEPGRAAGQGAGPARAVATEPLPKPPADAGLVEWNERVQLTPEQRAERREQFREFVDGAEIDAQTQISRGDYLFKSGKRYVGPSKAFEARMYTVRISEDMHPDWIEALDPAETAVKMEVHGAEAIIHDSHVHDGFRSTGLGSKLYRTAIDAGLAEGRVVNSDPSMSENSIALWKSLRNKGYDVIQRVPDRLLEQGDDGQFSARDGMTSIFFVAKKKPPMPDLPISNRDLTNQIEEARALNEHIPSCIKGK